MVFLVNNRFVTLGFHLQSITCGADFLDSYRKKYWACYIPLWYYYISYMYIHISFSMECQLTSNVHTGHLSMDWMGSINLLFSRLTLLLARKSQKQIQLKCTEQRWLVLEDKFIINCVFSFLFFSFLFFSFISA